MSAALSAYKTENWQSFAGFIRSFLIKGLRLSAHLQTGEMPKGDPEPLVARLSLGEARTELDSWLQRLSKTSQGETLTREEATRVGNFAIRLLCRLKAIPSSWEDQFFSILPRVTPLPSPSPTPPKAPLKAGRTAQEPTEPLSLETAKPPQPTLAEEDSPETPTPPDAIATPHSETEAHTSIDLLVEAEDVIEEVTSTERAPQKRRAVEVDIEAAQQRRELAPLVPVALAVLRLPEDQPLLDDMEAALQQEDYLVAQFVDLTRHPSATEALQLDRGSIRLRFDGTERILKAPKAEHLLANIRQIRALKMAPGFNGDIPPDTSPRTTPQVESEPVTPAAKRKRSRQEKQKTLVVAAG
jgi:hypothetical protein